jgi:hypothetical protein
MTEKAGSDLYDVIIIEGWGAPWWRVSRFTVFDSLVPIFLPKTGILCTNIGRILEVEMTVLNKCGTNFSSILVLSSVQDRWSVISLSWGTCFSLWDLCSVSERLVMNFESLCLVQYTLRCLNGVSISVTEGEVLRNKWRHGNECEVLKFELTVWLPPSLWGLKVLGVSLLHVQLNTWSDGSRYDMMAVH